MLYYTRNEKQSGLMHFEGSLYLNAWEAVVVKRYDMIHMIHGRIIFFVSKQAFDIDL